MKKFAALKAKTYNYLIDDGRKDKKNKRHKKVCHQHINKIALSLNNDNRMQLINSIKIYAYETSKDLVNEKEDIKSKNIIKRYEND